MDGPGQHPPGAPSKRSAATARPHDRRRPTRAARPAATAGARREPAPEASPAGGGAGVPGGRAPRPGRTVPLAAHRLSRVRPSGAPPRAHGGRSAGRPDLARRATPQAPGPGTPGPGLCREAGGAVGAGVELTSGREPSGDAPSARLGRHWSGPPQAKGIRGARAGGKAVAVGARVGAATVGAVDGRRSAAMVGTHGAASMVAAVGPAA